MSTRLVIGALACTAAMVTACTMKDQKAPALTGPSEFGTSITLAASPDAILQDGASQSVITAIVRDATGQPLRSAPLRAEIRVGGVAVDFGALSAKNVVTGADGRATFVYTAPPAVSSLESVDQNTIVDIAVTPVGTDFNNATARSVAIRLLPVGVVLPPNGKPVADFTFSPTTATENVKILFDASASRDGDGRIVRYDWMFGDGETGSGITISRAYTAPGTYNVTLTVTDDRGATASATKGVTVGTSQPPTAAFSVSPAAPQPKQDVFFNASASAAASGHGITSYAWTFGDGHTATGVNVSHPYAAVGTYTVTLTVTDDAGKTNAATQQVTVAVPTPTVGLAQR